ncbi:MAG: nitrous oxide reductase accessory protein NosL [Chitinophagaceae bacterium]|nr:nitrous oxide reductase accessory protein NosL [Chitinophagaceae bacterium]
MKHKLSFVFRVIVLIASLAMATVLFLPIWKISLVAPQYPEGLTMKIWATKLTGDVAIINGLNHYIGMKTLHDEDFIEFKILPFVIIGYALLGLLVLFLNRRIFLRLYAILFVIIAAVSLTDFYFWEYAYGHNLDPSAPIQVPGMAYQPPLIGYKQLLNFSAFSFPDIGGFIFAICGALIIGSALWDFFQERKIAKKSSKLTLMFVIPFFAFISLSLSSCSQSPQPIKYGADNCDNCKMTIMDAKFAGELITAKGKVMRFDDAHCLLAYLQSEAFKNQKAAAAYLTDFSGDHKFVNTENAFFLSSPKLGSPMNGNVATFAVTDSLKKIQQQLGGEVITWKQLSKQ